MAVDDAERDDLLDRLGEEFAARLRRGEQPSLKDYADRYPELAEEIHELFPAMVKVEQVKEICHDWEEAETRTAPLSQVGDYRIIREIGHGGMGVVYEAEQISLGRRVAVKVLPWQVAKDRTTLERFRREARASARLHHTNIVPVFEVGQDGDVRYYAMQFIQGQSLDSVIDELRRLRGRSPAVRGNRPAPADEQESHRADSATRGAAARLRLAQTLLSGRFDQGSRVVVASPAARVPEASPLGSVGPESVPPMAPDTSAVMPGGAQLSSVESRHRAFHRGVAHIGRQAASALAHAPRPWHRPPGHQAVEPAARHRGRGLGQRLRPGQGRRRRPDPDRRHPGHAPLHGPRAVPRPGGRPGRRLLAGPDPLRAAGATAGLRLARPRGAIRADHDGRAAPARAIDPRVPRDLETIVLKAIEKDRSDRYATAEAMAEDLRRFLDDQPILRGGSGPPSGTSAGLGVTRSSRSSGAS